MKNVLLLSLILFYINSFAINRDSLLQTKFKCEKPFLIINITSTECMTCRAGAANILNKLSGVVNKSKIFLLSDDKAMSVYYNKYHDIYDGYSKVFDKNLSRALASGPSSSAFLWQRDRSHCFPFANINNDTIDYFIKSLNEENSLLNSYIIKDSLFNNVPAMLLADSHAFLFNEQFQIGMLYNYADKSASYLQPQYNDSVIDALYDILKENNVKKLTNAGFGRETVVHDGVPEATVYGLNAANNSLLLKLYAVSIDTVKNNDSIILVMPKTFLAWNTSSSDLFDISKYRNFLYFDSIHYKNNILDPLLDNNYVMDNDIVYMPYWDIEHSKSKDFNGRQIKFATDVSIVAFTNAGKKAKIKSIYKINEPDGPGNFYIRIADGYPVVISETNKTILFLKTGRKIYFKDFTINNSDTINKIFDISFYHDTVKFIASTVNKNIVKVSYFNNNVSAHIISSNNYDNMKIFEDKIIAYRKDHNTEEIVLDEFAF